MHNFGLFSNGLRLHGRDDTFDEDVREVVTCEAAGYAEAWFSEHTSPDRPIHGMFPIGLPAAELLICKLAGLTERIRLGPAVRRIGLYQPQLVAIETAIADRLSDGRYNLGIGIGPPVTNYEQWGIDPADAADRTFEAHDLIMRCLESREPFDWDGRFFQGQGINLYPKPLQQKVPVAVATTRDSLLELSAKNGYRILTTWSARTEALADMGRRFDQFCLKHHGRTKREDIIACRAIYVADTDEKAYAHVEADWTRHVELNNVAKEPGGSQFVVKTSGERAGGGSFGVTFKSMVEAGNIIIGSPRTVIDKLRAFEAQVGGYGTLLLVGGRDVATPDQRDAMFHLFAEAVAPKLIASPPIAVAA